MIGKRSNFERKGHDFYRTPYEAVVPLLPHLNDETFFSEPCAGDGALTLALQKSGHICKWQSDIDPQVPGIRKMDAFNLDVCHGDEFITNPAWKWETLNPLITHLSDIAPTWLLLNADLMHNKRMGPHMRRCQKVVSVGRVSWMQNGKNGFENCAWYLFLPPVNLAWRPFTEFYGRQ